MSKDLDIKKHLNRSNSSPSGGHSLQRPPILSKSSLGETPSYRSPTTTLANGRSPSSTNQRMASYDQHSYSPVRTLSSSVRLPKSRANSNPRQYLTQEKNYLKNIKNDIADDYYTQAIISDTQETDEESQIEAELDVHERDLFVSKDIAAGTNLEIDYVEASFVESNRENSKILERLEWQTMLNLVLTGDVVKSEKRRIITQADFSLQSTYKDNLWLGIRAYRYGRTEDQQTRIIEYYRSTADSVFNSILHFKVEDEENAIDEVQHILEQYYVVKEQWRDQKDMAKDKPIVATDVFCERIDAMVSWKNITRTLQGLMLTLQKWTQSNSLNLTEIRHDGFVDTSFADTMVKEKDILAIFNARIFRMHYPWLNKSKEAYINYNDLFEELRLPSYIPTLESLVMFPLRLIQEIVRIRLEYARKLESPTMMMIDEMIDDFSLYFTLAVGIKQNFLDFTKGWDIELEAPPDYDASIFEGLEFFFGLIQRKLINTTTKSFRTFKEPDDLENLWKLSKNIGCYIDLAGPEIALQVASLTTKMTQRLNVYLYQQGRLLDGMTCSAAAAIPQSQDELMSFVSSSLDNFNTLRRRLAKFATVIRRAYSNAALFSVTRPGPFLEILKNSNHFLIQTGYKSGVYILASGNLYGRDDEIIKILKGAEIGSDFHRPRSQISDIELDVYEEEVDIGYMLVIHAARPMLWEGSIVSIPSVAELIVNTDPGEVMLVTQGSTETLKRTSAMFTELVGDNVFFIENRSSLTTVQRELVRTEKVYFKMAINVFSEFYKSKAAIQRIGRCHESIHHMYIFVRDMMKVYVRYLSGPKKTIIIKKMISFSIDWVSYIVDDCIPTDKKSFRWCVTALEFGMEISKGFNILTLSDDQFTLLKDKVAGCMSLLISHFDIMGARSSEAEKKVVNFQPNADLDDETILEHYKAITLEKLRQLEISSQPVNVGKVLDDTVQENQYLSFLASSFSSLSIRWQKRKFLGGGSFGSVFSALNLDTGGVLAVKEIRFQDIQSIKRVVPLIKDEMTVLEMLNHPNIVQYYGVEVHRDRVNLFMEYCEGGSLASLLEHGRIEDETVIQVYSLQMFEGLAYLHDMGILHRDIKPENILLDHNGLIKFVDFGAGKVLAKNATNKPATKVNSMTGTPMYMSPEVITGSHGSKYSLDVWSTGCCVLEMATGRRPWANLDNEWAIMYHIAAGHLPQFPNSEQLSAAGIKFLYRCLERDPTKRATAQKLLEDPWLVDIRLQAFGESPSSSEVSSEAGW